MIRDHMHITSANEDLKVLIYEKGMLIYIFNFHTSNNILDHEVGTNWNSEHLVLLSSHEGLS